MAIIDLSAQMIPEQEIVSSISHTDMIEAVSRGDVYAGFLGGVEVLVSDTDKVYDVIDGEEVLFVDKFPSYISLDGAKALIRICSPHPQNPKKAWHNSTAEVFQKFVDGFSVELFLTKSEFQAKLDSAEYRSPAGEL